MPNAERITLYAVFTVLWLSGVCWLILDVFFSHKGEFGVVPHPWQAPLLLTHGLVSVPALYLIGWVAARHASPQWKVEKRRRSGGAFALALGLLVVSGFALFFLTSEAGQRFSALAHDVIGVALTLFLIEHWFVGRRKSAKTR